MYLTREQEDEIELGIYKWMSKIFPIAGDKDKQALEHLLQNKKYKAMWDDPEYQGICPFS